MAWAILSAQFSAGNALLQTHLKERLTGAALLVVIVVLLVPEMFRGRPASVQQPAGTALEGPPVRSYNIDLRDNGAAQPLPAGAPLSAGTPLGPGTVPAAAAPVATPPTAAAPAPAAASSSEVAPLPVVPTAAAPISKPPSAPAAAPAHATAPVHIAAHSGWTVQVGSYVRRDFAERMVKQMKAKGFAVQVAGPDDRGLYRVRSAPFAERASAMALRQQMQQKGLKPIVNTVP
jgi:cell division septation protein DedD